MQRKTQLLTLCVVALFTPALAQAQPASDSEVPPVHVVEHKEPPPPERLWSMALNLGTGTPQGVIVLARDFVHNAHLGVRTSLGLGFGPLVSVMPFVGTHVPGLGLLRLSGGASAGMFDWRERGGFCFTDECAAKRSWLLLRGNVETSIELRSDGGWLLKPYVGFSIVAAGNLTCVGKDESVDHCRIDHAAAGDRVFYGGISMGKAW